MSPDQQAGPRVLHAMLMASFEPGIYQQLAWEQEAAEAENIPWDARIFTSLTVPDPADIMVCWKPAHRIETTRAGAWLAFRRAYYSWLEELAGQYDVVLVRHSPYDPLRPRAVRSLAETVDMVGTVHHTLDVPELRSGTPRPKAALLSAAETLLGPRSIQVADVIVGVTPGIVSYEQGRVRTTPPTLVYPNGAAVAGEVADRRGERPELLFVAGRFRPWHGLDLLLESIPRCDAEFTLHVVGRVEPHLSAGCTDARVVLHGVLPPDEIRRLSSSAWIGVSSLALDRQGMQEATPLKVREYLIAGLPVYAGHRDVFPADSDVFEVGRPDIADIVAFARRTRRMSKQAVRDTAMPYIDKRVLVRQLYRALTRLRGTGQVK